MHKKCNSLYKNSSVVLLHSTETKFHLKENTQQTLPQSEEKVGRVKDAEHLN